MNIPNRFLALVLATAVFSLLRTAAFAQTVDEFTQMQTANSGATLTTEDGGMTVLGRYRDAIFIPDTGNTASLTIAGGSLSFTRDAMDASNISVDWDGDNDASTFEAEGLGGIDLTEGGATGFQFSATINSSTLDFKILVHTNDPDASEVPVSTSDDGTTTVCYSDFTLAGGTGADFASVGAIQLVTTGSSAQDWSIGALTYGAVGGCFLPVEMTAFDGLADGSSVALTWTTASEGNTLGFAVERRPANPSAGNWQEIGFVDATGSTAEARTYRFRATALPAGRHAFRLRVVDADGQFDYSETIEASVESPGSFVLGGAYPNPFNPTTAFTLSVKQAQYVDIALFDLLGRNVQRIYAGPVEANDARSFTVDGATLPTGVYLIHARGQFGSESTPIMLVK